MANIGERISDLIGSNYEVIPEYSKVDLINAAIYEVADMLPAELLMKYSATSAAITNSSGMDAPEEKKILLVTREETDAVGSPSRECKPVPYHEFLRCGDSGSLYFATSESPVYTYDMSVDGDPKLKVLPDPTGTQAVQVFYFDYPTTDATVLSEIPGLPNSVIHAVIIKSCVNLLHTYLSDFIQDEEDAELQQMVSAQVQALMAQYQAEMMRFVEQDATPRGE